MAELEGTPGGARADLATRQALAGALRVADVTSTVQRGRRARRRHHRPAPRRRRRPARRPAGLRAASPASRPRGRSSSRSPRAPTATSATPPSPCRPAAPAERDAVTGAGRGEPVIRAVRSPSSASSSPPGCGGAWPSRSSSSRCRLRRPLRLPPHERRRRGGPEARVADGRRDPDREQRLHRRPVDRLPAAADDRHPADRVGVPPQDDLGTFLATPRAPARDAGQGRGAARYRRHLRPAQPRRVGRASGAIVLGARGQDAFPSTDDRADAGAQPARARPVGAHRAGHRHPHPQPGRGAAHRGRRRPGSSSR